MVKISSCPPPPVECEGYPPPASHISNLEEVGFFLSCDEGLDSTDLACTITIAKSSSSSTPSQERENKTTTTIQEVIAFVDTTKPVVILCHGVLSWRNQTLLANLAAHLSLQCHHVIRFDFYGNGHSAGPWRYANYAREFMDLVNVVEFARNILGCNVVCIIGHSKGSVAVLRHASEQEPPTTQNEDEKVEINKFSSQGMVPCYVTISGRFSSRGDFTPADTFSKQQLDELSTTGEIVIGTRGRRKFTVSKDDIEERIAHDMAFVSKLRSSVVLIIHGDADTKVPVENSQKFAQVIPRHELHVIHGANHNYSCLQNVNEISSIIVNFIHRQII